MMFDLPSLRSVFQSPRKNRTDVSSMFDDFFSNYEHNFPYSLLSRRDKDFVPQLDASETNSHYCLEFDLPGVTKENLNIKIDNNILNIKGQKNLDAEHKDSNFYIKERFYGDFQRSLALPLGTDTDAITADFKEGVLKIKIPKTATSTTKSIDIKG